MIYFGCKKSSAYQNSQAVSFYYSVLSMRIFDKYVPDVHIFLYIVVHYCYNIINYSMNRETSMKF